MSKVELGRQVWTEVNESAHLLVPLGSTEQHGPHLPMITDSLIAEAVAHGAARRAAVTVAPVLAYGASGEHAGFAGTLSIGTEVLQTVVIELVRSAALTFSAVTLVNGHGGNRQAVSRAVGQLVAEGHAVTSWSPSIPGGDAHAGRTETSLMLAIAPELVRMQHAEQGNTAALVDIIDELRAAGVQAASPNGVLGDPTGASAAEGETMLDALISDLVGHLSSPRVT